MTHDEINARATCAANLALAASTCTGEAEKLLIMEVAASLANSITRPAYTLTADGNVIPFRRTP